MGYSGNGNKIYVEFERLEMVNPAADLAGAF
jgi:hypothetical protein